MKSDFPYHSELVSTPLVITSKVFEELYSVYWRRLYDFALLKTQDKDVAEELIQDLFVTIWEKRGDLQITNLQSYLFVALRNRIITYYKQKVFADLDHAHDQVTPDYPLFIEELEAALQEAMELLPQKTHDIFLLNRFDGKSAQEISQELAIPQRTVEYHITQALRHLKTLFKHNTTTIITFISSMTF